MALTTSYLSSTKNLDSILNSLINARAPERFTNKFLDDLGYKSSNDRLIIGMLKAFGLLDDNGVPTKRYYEFLDQSLAKKVLAVGVQEAYEDLFNLRKDAQNMTNDEVRNKLRTLTQGQKGDRVIALMSMTFRAFCDYADWSDSPSSSAAKSIPIEDISETSEKRYPTPLPNKTELGRSSSDMNLCYSIQIHLPETTNMAVYDAIFQSLKKHLF